MLVDFSSSSSEFSSVLKVATPVLRTSCMELVVIASNKASSVKVLLVKFVVKISANSKWSAAKRMACDGGDLAEVEYSLQRSPKTVKI